MLRIETEFILSDVNFSKWDEKSIIGICCDSFETKYIGQITIWRRNNLGQLDEIQSIALETGGINIKETSKYPSFLISAHTDPILRLWNLNKLIKPIKRYSYHNMSIEDLKTDPFNGDEFISCSKDSTFAIWNISESEPLNAFTNDSSIPILSVEYHPSNPSLFFVAPLDGKIEIYNKEEKKKIIYNNT